MDAAQSTVTLNRLINQYFDREELRTLCFELSIDYDGLRGDGKTAKARELVAWVERHGRLEELEVAVCRARPGLGVNFRPRRAQELQTLLLTELQPALRAAFEEFTAQVDAYLSEFTQLHRELEEWKELHNLLQDLQNSFATCRGYAFSLARIQGADPASKTQRERLIYEAEVNWQPCKRVLDKIEELASSVQWISEPYDEGTGNGPMWFIELVQLSAAIDASFFNTDLANLPDQLSDFGGVMDRWLYRADKSLRKVVQKINRLPPPQSFLVQKE